jgi:hypothetical protein
MCHAFYMMWFNAIDILNKLALGPGTVAYGWNPHNGVQDELENIFYVHVCHDRDYCISMLCAFYQLP